MAGHWQIRRPLAKREPIETGVAVSDRDSFIDEVSEEVRRDRLYGLLRRYGWIAIVAVLLIVGGAAFLEWRAAGERRAAESYGDAILDSLGPDDAAERARLLGELPPPETAAGRAMAGFLRAAVQLDADDRPAAAETLTSLADAGDLPAEWSDLARLKAVMLAADDMTPDERIARLEPLTAPGAPYRLLAEEQIALAEIDAGDRDAALARLTDLIADAEVTPSLRARVSQLVVALGGTLGAA